MIRMIRLFNEVNILRVEIDGETQVDRIIKTLSDSFSNSRSTIL